MKTIEILKQNFIDLLKIHAQFTMERIEVDGKDGKISSKGQIFINFVSQILIQDFGELSQEHIGELHHGLH